MKKVIALLLAVLMLTAVFAGCAAKDAETQQPAPTDEQTPDAQPTPSEETPDAPETEEPFEISMLVVQQAGAPLSEDMEVIQELQKRTNTKLTITSVAEDDMPQQIQSMILANQLPDLIEYRGTEANSLLESGTLLYLNDYVNAENTPNLWKFMEENPDYSRDIHDDNGNIAYIAQATTRKWRCDWIINNTFLQELGMDMPNDIDSMYAYLKAVKEKYPDATPLGVGPWAGGRNAVIQPVMYMFNVTNEFWQYEDGVYEYGPYERQDAYKQALEFLNKLYNEGLIDPEFWSISAEDTNAKISNNQVGLIYGWDDGYGQWGVDGTWGIDMVPCDPLAGPDGFAYIRPQPRKAQQFQYVTSSCKDPARLLQFVDYCFSDEGVELLNWGIEGDHWEMKDGERVYTDKIMKNENGYVIGRYACGLAHPRLATVIDGDAELLLNGKETAKHVENMSLDYVKVFASIPSLTATPEEEEEYNLIFNDVNDAVKEAEAQLITGAPEDFEAGFEALAQRLEDLNCERACEIRQAIYQRWLAR